VVNIFAANPAKQYGETQSTQARATQIGEEGKALTETYYFVLRLTTFAQDVKIVTQGY